MASMLDPIKKIANATTTAAIDNKLSKRTADVLKTLVESVFDVVDDALVKVQELTKAEETPGEGP